MVVIIEASPRANGNGAAMGKHISEKYAASGRKVIHYKLREINFSGCINCRGCKDNDSFCVVEDGLVSVWENLATASSIVFIAPSYYGFVNSTMKAFFDRIYCMRSEKGVSRFKPGAKGILVLTQGALQRDAASMVNTWFGNFISIYGLKHLELTVPGCDYASIDAVNFRKDDILLNLTFFD